MGQGRERVGDARLAVARGAMQWAAASRRTERSGLRHAQSVAKVLLKLPSHSLLEGRGLGGTGATNSRWLSQSQVAAKTLVGRGAAPRNAAVG